jgi:ABC-2 type transport system permease protein
MLVNGVKLHPTLIYVPLNILELYIAALALAFFLSAVMVKYRDIGYIWEVVLQGFFYATPIIYPITMVQQNSETAAKLLLLNPVAQIIQDTRYNMVTHQTITTFQLIKDPFIAAIPFVIITVVGIAGGLYFRKRSRYFAEDI